MAALHGDSLSRCLTRTAGLVLVEHTKHRMQLSINCSAISEVAFAAVIYELADHAENTGLPVFLLGEENTVLRFSNGYAAIQQVLSQWKSMSRLPRKPFRRERIPLGGAKRAPFRQLVMICSTDKVMDLTLVRSFLRRAFCDRFLIVQPAIDEGQLKLIEVGAGYPRLDEAWRRRSLGSTFAEFGDKGYNTFVQDAYREAWNARQPILEEIEASLTIGPLPPAVVTYERLLVPIRIADGPGLLSATLIKD